MPTSTSYTDTAAHQRYEIFLRGCSGRLRWRERRFFSGFRDANSRCAAGSDRPLSNGWKRRGELELVSQFERNQLFREALHQQRHRGANRGAHFYQLHRYRSHQRYEIFLRGCSGGLRWRERQFFSGFRDANSRCAAGSDRPLSNGWKRRGELELVSQFERNQLLREALHQQRHRDANRGAHFYQLHRYRAHQRYEIFLRGCGVDSGGESANSSEVSATPTAP